MEPQMDADERRLTQMDSKSGYTKSTKDCTKGTKSFNKNSALNGRDGGWLREICRFFQFFVFSLRAFFVPFVNCFFNPYKNESRHVAGFSGPVFRRRYRALFTTLASRGVWRRRSGKGGE